MSRLFFCGTLDMLPVTPSILVRDDISLPVSPALSIVGTGPTSAVV